MTIQQPHQNAPQISKSPYAGHFPPAGRTLRGRAYRRPFSRKAGVGSKAHPQLSLDVDDEIRVDLFCGGGGASEGIEMATGEPVHVAVNHDSSAIAMHMANHPQTEHYLSGVYDVCPRAASRGRSVGHLHASPDCTHFSQARGGQPRSRAIRSLTWIVKRWAGTVAPRLITMENVEAMRLWTRLVAKRDSATGRVIKLDGSVAAPGERVPVQQQFLVPDTKSLGRTFRKFLSHLSELGYVVEHRTLVAADFGAPTTRERLYLIARNDNQPIIWPEPTHSRDGSKTKRSWRGAHECIDWRLPAQSIFERSKSLAPATLRRVAKGLQRFILQSPSPFLVPGASGHAVDSSTAPFMVHAGHGEGSGTTRRRSHGVKSCNDPLGTITASAGGHALACATLIQTGYGERPGQEPRVPGLDKPLGTVVAGGAKHAVVTAFLAQANAGFNVTVGHDVRRPMSTITNSGSQQQLVCASLVTFRHHSVGSPAQAPLSTIVAGGEHHAVMQCHLSAEVQERALLVAQLMRSTGVLPDDGSPLEPVTVVIDGITYAVVDITLRMLQPRELFRAQGFPEGYVIDRGADGSPLTKTAQIRMCGNSVSPVVMAAIVAANDWRRTPLRMAA